MSNTVTEHHTSPAIARGFAFLKGRFSTACLLLIAGVIVVLVVSPLIVSGWRDAVRAQRWGVLLEWADETCSRRSTAQYQAWIAETHRALRTVEYPRRTVRLQCQ